MYVCMCFCMDSQNTFVLRVFVTWSDWRRSEFSLCFIEMSINAPRFESTSLLHLKDGKKTDSWEEIFWIFGGRLNKIRECCTDRITARPRDNDHAITFLKWGYGKWKNASPLTRSDGLALSPAVNRQFVLFFSINKNNDEALCCMVLIAKHLCCQLH